MLALEYPGSYRGFRITKTRKPLPAAASSPPKSAPGQPRFDPYVAPPILSASPGRLGPTGPPQSRQCGPSPAEGRVEDVSEKEAPPNHHCRSRTRHPSAGLANSHGLAAAAAAAATSHLLLPAPALALVRALLWHKAESANISC